MLVLDPVVEDQRWTVCDPEHLCHDLSRLLSSHPPFLNTASEIAVLFSDDPTLQRLNHQFRDKDKPTNVLSFPSDGLELCTDDEPIHIGDIALSFDTISAEAALQAKPILHHVRHMIIHGVLHVVGYDHETEADANTMENLEIALLAKLEQPDPYR